MIPATYNLELYRGDTYYGPLITLPDLSPFGGPSDLLEGSPGGPPQVSAQIRAKAGAEAILATFTVDIVDAAARQIRCTLTPTETASITKSLCVWDLQAEAQDGWIGTVLAGEVAVSGEVTKDE